MLASSSGKTDDNGVSSFQTPLPQVTAPARVFAQAQVQSVSKQDLFSRKSVLLHPAAFYIGAKVPNKAFRANQPVTVDVAAVTVDGKPAQASPVSAKIRRLEWHSVRKVGLSGRLEWVSDKEEIELPSQTFAVPEKGGTFSFTPAQSGQYQVTFETQDAQGRLVRGGFDVMVYGKDGAPWEQGDDDLLTLKQDKNSYRPGEKARIHVQSPYPSAYALVSVEREGIIDAWTTSVKGGADYVEVPIKASYIPNVYVSVTLVRGRSGEPVNDKGVDLGKPQGKTGYVNLQVEPSGKKLTVDISTPKKEYRPGDEVTVRVSTKQGRKGVPAQVTLWAVDEGVLALTDYKTPNPFELFYGERPLSVSTADNRAYVIGQRSFGEKGENRGGGGSAYAKLGGVDLRSRFLFVPFYQARVQTDAKGRAEVRFQLPDNLTRFRIMAVAARTEEFGSAQTQIHVSKPLMVTANVPPVVRAGDQFACQAVVYNYADKKGAFTVEAAADGTVTLSGENPQTLTVPLGKAESVSWPCRADKNGTAKVLFSVKGRRESDAVATDVTVKPVEQTQTLALFNSTETSQEELLDKPAHIVTDGKNEVSVSLASTVLLNVKGAMTYLLQYPYDCLEQQLSKIRPVLVSPRLVKAFGVGDIETLKKQAQQTFDNLADYQDAFGGFGYWKNALPDAALTAYVLESAYLAKAAGFKVNEQTLKEAAAWLEKAFGEHAIHAFSYSPAETQIARAQSVYALALYGKNVNAAFNNLYSQRSAMSLPAAAYLLQAARVLKRPAAQQDALAQNLLNRVTYTPTAAYFAAGSPLPWLHITDVTATALSLRALAGAEVPFPADAQAVKWLLNQLNAQGHWNSTAENAAVLDALEAYANTHEAQEPHFTATVSADAKTMVNDTFNGRTFEAQTHHFPFDIIYATDSTARMKLAKTGTGTLYYQIAQTYTPQVYKTPVNAGFEVSRQITTPGGQSVSALQAGQRYQVTLTVRTPAARHFVVVEDFAAAGLEIINSSLATEDAFAARTDSPFTRTEYYGDRIAAFADYLPAGTHTFTYTVSAVTEGTFAYPSAWASLMYEPDVFGRNETQTCVIQ